MAICIICRTSKDDLTDEHVIPDSLGGYYHIYNVCKTCNSKMGSCVDAKLVNHLFGVFQRYSMGLKGKKGNIPNPFNGTHTIKNDDTQKVRLEIDEKGIFVPYLITETNAKKDGDKIQLEIKIDKRDEKKLPKIIEKIAKRNNIDVKNIKIDTDLDKYTHKFKPEVLVKAAIDLDDFKLGLLKIAYEFAVDSIPEYFEDEKAILISQYLENCKIDNNKNLFLGSGFEKDLFNHLKWMLDIGSNKHYLVLCPTKEFGLICMIYLSNMFSIAIVLSNKEHLVEDCIFGINDIDNKKFTKLNMQQLHDKVYSPSKRSLMYWFRDEKEMKEFEILEQSKDFEFYKDQNDNQPLYDSNGKEIYKDIDDKVELLLDKVKHLGTIPKSFISEVSFEDEELYIKINPSQTLIRVLKIREEQYFCKSI